MAAALPAHSRVVPLQGRWSRQYWQMVGGGNKGPRHPGACACACMHVCRLVRSCGGARAARLAMCHMPRRAHHSAKGICTRLVATLHSSRCAVGGDEARVKQLDGAGTLQLNTHGLKYVRLARWRAWSFLRCLTSRRAHRQYCATPPPCGRRRHLSCQSLTPTTRLPCCVLAPCGSILRLQGAHCRCSGRRLGAGTAG